MNPLDIVRSTIRDLLARRQPIEQTVATIRAAIGAGPPSAEQARQLTEADQSIRAIDAELDEARLRYDELDREQRKKDNASEMHRRLAGGGEDADPTVVRRGQRFAENPLVAREIAEARARRGQDAGEELSLGRLLRGAVTGDWHDARLEQRAMAEGSLAGGGYTVPVDLATGIIDRARNMGAVWPSGATTVPMDTQKLNIARLIGDPTAAFRLENATIPATDATFDQITLKARSLAALTVVSRELLEDSLNVDEVLEDAFAAQFALAIDAAALYGNGVEPNPLGLRNTSGITTVSMGTNGATPTSWDQVIDAVYALEDNNEHANGIVYSARTARTMAKLKDSTNQPLALPPALADLPRRQSNQVLNTQTQGTASGVATDVFVGDWTKLFIGLRTNFQVQVLTERYAETGQVGFLGWWRGDVAVARPKAFAVVQGVLA